MFEKKPDPKPPEKQKPPDKPRDNPAQPGKTPAKTGRGGASTMSADDENDQEKERAEAREALEFPLVVYQKIPDPPGYAVVQVQDEDELTDLGANAFATSEL